MTKRNPDLYTGAARYYAQGRMAYPVELPDQLSERLQLDGTGRLLDVGCGPGSLTLLLAGRFESALGVDADAGMLAEAERLAQVAGVRNVGWRRLYAEDLPAGLGSFRVITFAQSFHWMDRDRVAKIASGMLDAGGACIHVHATTHRGIPADQELPYPEPPHAELTELTDRFITRDHGPQHAAPALAEVTGEQEARSYSGAGLSWYERFEVSAPMETRTVDDVLAAIYSLSSSTPHLFGDRQTAFDVEARRLLLATSPSGLFSEVRRPVAVDIWLP
jgi:cyclopropane fatty-acyl-phospholipid synthase-like methyltransferase